MCIYAARCVILEVAYYYELYRRVLGKSIDMVYGFLSVFRTCINEQKSISLARSWNGYFAIIHTMRKCQLAGLQRASVWTKNCKRSDESKGKI